MSESEAAVKGVRRPTSKERQNRFRLALWIVSFVLLAITALAFTVILATPADERAEVANDLFVALLPVFAAWVGTVIAFYFGQENFESASEQAQALVATTSGHDVQTPVTDVMQPIHEMVTYRMTGEAADVRLSDLQSDTYFGKVNRLLVVDEVDHPLLLVHRSRLADYLSADGDPAGSLEDFLESERAKSPPMLYDAGNGFVTVASTSNLAAAKVAMEAVPGVADLIVTRAGGTNEPVWGWITDVQLREQLRA